MKKVMLAGTFDLLHIGHIRLFKWVKRRFKNYELVVIVSRDCNARRIKKRELIFNEKERKEMVGAIKYVDRAILGDRRDFLKIIRKEKPDVFVLGYDQEVDESIVKKMKEMGISIVRAPAFNPAKYKSSRIISLIHDTFGQGYKGVSGKEEARDRTDKP